MSGDYGPSQKDTQFTAPKDEPKPEDRGGKDELDKDKVYGELFAKMNALKNLRDFTNFDHKLVSGLFDDRGKLFGYDEREKELQERIDDVFTELYKRGYEIKRENSEERDDYRDFMSNLRAEVSKGGFGIPNRQ